jgi:hypothetical protein
MLLRLSKSRSYHIKWIRRVRTLHWLYSSMSFRRYDSCVAMSISVTNSNTLSKSLMNIVVSCEPLNSVKNWWSSLELAWESFLISSLRGSIKRFIVMVLSSWWCQGIHILIYSSERTRIDRDSFNSSWIVSWNCFAFARGKDWWKTQFR